MCDRSDDEDDDLALHVDMGTIPVDYGDDMADSRLVTEEWCQTTWHQVEEQLQQ